MPSERAKQVAGLLHDVDDYKLFPNNKNYENLKMIMKSFSDEDVNLVIEMVSYVSCSKNGDTVPQRAIKYPWLLYPRYADRLEAIGYIGIARCYQYSKGKIPLFTDDTKKPIDEHDLFNNIATRDRFLKYNGTSDSFIDHFYDKLLRLADVDMNNDYFESVKLSRKQIMIDFVMGYAKSGSLDVAYLKTLVLNNL